MNRNQLTQNGAQWPSPVNNNNNNNPWRYSSDEPWPAEQPQLAVFPDCNRRYWVDMWSAHRIPQLHFQLSELDRYFFIQVTTQFIRSRG
jgi:glucan phosphorylase